MKEVEVKHIGACGFAIDFYEHPDKKYGDFVTCVLASGSWGIECHARSKQKALAFALREASEKLLSGDLEFPK